MKLSMRDARLQAMRGNLDSKILRKEEPAPTIQPVPEPQIREVPVASSVTVDTSAIAHAMTSQTQMLANAMQQMKPEPGAPAPAKWVFRITERDRMGNIISFTAEAK